MTFRLLLAAPLGVAVLMAAPLGAAVLMAAPLGAAVLMAAPLGAAVLLAPPALADPPNIPTAGSESAAATIGDLDDAGFDVVTQFENGAPTVPLSQCTVTDINTVGAAGSQPLAYVTINCPK